MIHKTWYIRQYGWWVRVYARLCFMYYVIDRTLGKDHGGIIRYTVPITCDYYHILLSYVLCIGYEI